jgi:hypothetical protein
VDCSNIRKMSSASSGQETTSNSGRRRKALVKSWSCIWLESATSSRMGTLPLVFAVIELKGAGLHNELILGTTLGRVM